MKLNRMFLIGALTFTSMTISAEEIVLQNGLKNYNGCKDAGFSYKDGQDQGNENNVSEYDIYYYKTGYRLEDCTQGNR